MNLPRISVRQEDSYTNVSSPETGQNEEPSTSMEYTYLSLPTRPRRLKRDSMSSVDSNSSEKLSVDEENSEQASPSETPKRTGKKRGRKPTQMNLEAKLERSRQSARECRARKKLRYQCLEDTIAEKEAKVYALRKEVHKVSPTRNLPDDFINIYAGESCMYQKYKVLCMYPIFLNSIFSVQIIKQIKAFSGVP